MKAKWAEFLFKETAMFVHPQRYELHILSKQMFRINLVGVVEKQINSRGVGSVDNCLGIDF